MALNMSTRWLESIFKDSIKYSFNNLSPAKDLFSSNELITSLTASKVMGLSSSPKLQSCEAKSLV